METIKLTTGRQAAVRAIAIERQRTIDEANRRIAEYNEAEKALVEAWAPDDGDWGFAMEGDEIVLRRRDDDSLDDCA